MRITKTRAQAEEDEQRRQEALEQTEICPECGIHRIEVRERDIGTYEEIMIIFRPVVTSEGDVYHCQCLNCGCQWDTTPWNDGSSSGGEDEPSPIDEEEHDYAEAGRILLGVVDEQESDTNEQEETEN